MQTLTAQVATMPDATAGSAAAAAAPSERTELRYPPRSISSPAAPDLTQIDGIAPYTARKLVAEIGTDMRRWPTEKHFTSWLTLAPKGKSSGGKLLGSRTEPSANRAAAILRMSAYTLNRSQTALGAFLSTRGRSHWKAAGHHRDCAQAGDPRVPRP